MGGYHFASSYHAFVTGFDTTKEDIISVLSVTGDVVTAKLVAVQVDGAELPYQGTYTISGDQIVAADVRSAG